jgi:hypothetical protein
VTDVNVETDLKVGDVVTVKGNRLFWKEVYQTKIIAIGLYPSMWLPPGEKRWGATFEIPTMEEDFEDGIYPEVYESSPMLADQFAWVDDHWELQLR